MALIFRFKDELIIFWWSKVKDQRHCKLLSVPFLLTLYLRNIWREFCFIWHDVHLHKLMSLNTTRHVNCNFTDLWRHTMQVHNAVILVFCCHTGSKISLYVGVNMFPPIWFAKTFLTSFVFTAKCDSRVVEQNSDFVTSNFSMQGCGYTLKALRTNVVLPYTELRSL